ncbi:MAG TPA: hypothetical protein VM840_13465 [Actinomycetota bacterium]|nr:hypothetical protein [Actinomycetota bacterium]
MTKIATAACVLLVLVSGCGRDRTSDAPRSPSPRTAPTGDDEATNASGQPDGTRPGSPRPGSAARRTPTPEAPGTPVPYARVKENEAVTWEQALAWWPYRPLLRYNGPPKPGLDGSEAVFATSQKGGRKGDPRKEFSVLTVFWQVPGTDSSNSTYLAMVEAGGMAVSARFYPPSIPFEKTAQGGKAVVVRGTNAWMTELRTDRAEAEKESWREYGSQDIRYIQWQEYLPRDSGTIDWLVMTHATGWTERESVDAVNAMVEVR